MLALTAGTFIELWLADSIDTHGLGNGISFIICVSIMSGESVFRTWTPEPYHLEYLHPNPWMFEDSRRIRNLG